MAAPQANVLAADGRPRPQLRPDGAAQGHCDRQHIPSIELKGVTPTGQTVYDLRLGDVVLTTYHDTNSGHDMLSFSYQQVSLTTTPQKAGRFAGHAGHVQLGPRHQLKKEQIFRIPSSLKAAPPPREASTYLSDD